MYRDSAASPRGTGQVRVTVGICSFKRPDMLRQLLLALEEQILPGDLRLSVVVVDNDPHRSAFATVTQHASVSRYQVDYLSEPKPNIAVARNRCLSHSDGEFCAFVDDDEIPERDWLASLFAVAAQSGAAAVLGPVLSRYAGHPSKWVVKSGLLDRPRYATGRTLRSPDTRTGNVLLRMAPIRENGVRFDPRFGRLGGEDVMFFRRFLGIQGVSAIWCDEAVVSETVPPRRARLKGILKRARMQGQISFHYERASVAWRTHVSVKAISALFVYLLLIPASGLTGLGRAMRYVVKSVHHASRLFAALGFSGIRERTV